MKLPANDTDHLKLTRTVNRDFNEQCDLGVHCETQPGPCQIFRAFGGRHFQVELYGSNELTVVSVRRLAYALQNPDDHVAADEEVWTTCEHKGDPKTGDGTCVAHLRKVTKAEVALVRAHNFLIEKLS